jgi:hypothetical protein
LFGDARVSKEMNWGIQDLPERVQDNALAFVARRGVRKNAQQPRLDLSVVKKVGVDLGHPPGSLQATYSITGTGVDHVVGPALQGWHGEDVL